jgi:hypothetical protein
MELLIRGKAGDPGTDIDSFDVPDNAFAAEVADLAILASAGVLKNELGLSPVEWENLVGDQFYRTGVSALTAQQRAKAMLIIFRKHWIDRVQDGKRIRRRNQETLESAPTDSDITFITL